MFTNEKVQTSKEKITVQKKETGGLTNSGFNIKKSFAQNNYLESSIQNNFGDLRVHYNSNLVQRMPIPVIQFWSKDDIETILKLCKKHNFNDVSEQDAIKLCEDVEAGYTPRIKNHHAVLRKWRQSFRIESKTFSGGGMMGRVEKTGGTDVSFSNGGSKFFSLPDMFTKSVTITKDAVMSVGERESLNGVMGGSAYSQTGIQDSEHLHMVGHQLIGDDTKGNLMPGYHATNTAMIPIENLVHDIALSGIEVAYKVQFLPRVGPSLWVSDAVIEVALSYGGKNYVNCWYIQVNDSGRMSQTSYANLVKSVQDYRKSIFDV